MNAQAGERVELVEDFSRRGNSTTAEFATPDLVPRILVDPEGMLSVDNGALRIAPLLEQGWGRAALAYGPLSRQNGLTLSVYLLNGHNTAQVENLPESLVRRLDRWWLGCGEEGRVERLLCWIRSGRMRRTLRLFRWWLHLRKSRRSLDPLDENLAIGWFPDQAPANPAHAGNGFVMHATGGDNGELWARSSSRSMCVLRAVPDIPLGLVVVLRQTGAAYYVAATPGSRGLPAYPVVRPVAIDVRSAEPTVYGVLSPSAFGQIGFRIDTRVYSVRIATPVEFSGWYGTAVAADNLSGKDALTSIPAECGGRWTMLAGEIARTRNGVRAMVEASQAVLRTAVEIGLVHARVMLESATSRCGLIARAVDARNMIRVLLSLDACEIQETVDGVTVVLGTSAGLALALGVPISVQLTLDGTSASCAIEGDVVVRAEVSPATVCGDASGIQLDSADVLISHFEAHPSRIRLPASLCAMPLELPPAARPLVVESFHGQSRPLQGSTTSCGSAVWVRSIGQGEIEVTGESSARVLASAREPNPGRTAYTIPWQSPDLGDLEMELTVPGTDAGQRHKPRGGFIFWQDADNFLIVSLWRGDEYPGASISSFFQIDGFEDIYDAVWTNIGRRAWYGERLRLRVTFDGMQFLASVDGEPVLYRRLTDVYPSCARLSINRVGIVANWEWGNDTGSVFRDFVARGTTTRAQVALDSGSRQGAETIVEESVPRMAASAVAVADEKT